MAGMKMCERCGKPLYTGLRFCSRKCSALTVKKTGPDHPAWKGNNVRPETSRHRAQKRYPLKPCDICGSLRSERHHVDGNVYNNDVTNIRFLCRKHHMEVDQRRMWSSKEGYRRGTEAPTAKLTEEQVLEIRRLYATGNYTITVLGEMFGINYRTVSQIKRRESWTHI